MEDQELPWFSGSISEAVLKAKNEKLLFISYIHDESEKSEIMSKLLTDIDIVNIVKEKTVAIEMKKDSDTYRLFTQIFPVFFSPCLVFIQKGRLVSLINSDTTKEAIIESINKFSVGGQQENMSTSSSQQSLNNSNSSESISNQTNILKNSNSINIQERNKEKQKELEEKEKRYNEYRKIKLQNDERRKQILAQINQDRIENKENFEKMSKSNSKENIQKIINEQSPQEKSKIKNDSEFSVISIRYIDGKLLRNSFKKEEKLSNVRDWIDKNIKSEYHPYYIEKQYPNHRYTTSEEQKTLNELDLVYNDLLLCKPATKADPKNIKQSFEVGKYYSISFLKEIFFFLYAFILSFNIFSSPNKENEENEKNAEGHSLSGKKTNMSYKKGKIRITPEKKVGTIDDIRTDNKKDNRKEKETYNGNSTNQK